MGTSSIPGPNTGPNAGLDPELGNRTGPRTLFRIIGIVLALAGLVMLGYGFATFAAGVLSDQMPSMDQMGRSFLLFALGGVALIGGFFFVYLGFMGVAARYGAGETMPVLKDSAAYLTDGAGLFGVGRTVDDVASATDPGRDCVRCGATNAGSAKYCNACGSALA